ncbi:MAG TPA: phosphoribosylamine--glycine ligase [Gemmatimonadaceae bacterium]
MKVLLVGGGGREHALAWRLRQDDPSIELVAAPGNPGIAELATCVPVGVGDIGGLLRLAQQQSVDWTLVGPEAPLAAGIVDTFRAAGLAIFGPTRAAAMIEASKAFSKSLMADAGVPTARAVACDNTADAYRAIDELGTPVVIKASGLAAGKGVVICATAAEARAIASSMLSGTAFGAAGSTILVEEFMDGEELSVFALTDGTHTVLLPAAQDHKRLLDNDCGPNTGGMGAYVPVSIARSPTLMSEIQLRIIRPTLAAMRARGTPFTGVLFVGLMVTATGPRVVEFNCRFGDPETEALLPALSAELSLANLMFQIARGEMIPEHDAVAPACFAVTTVLAAERYPETPSLGDIIDLPSPPAGVLVFHSGTKRDEHGTLVTAGGRVLAVTGLGDSMLAAQQRSHDFAQHVRFREKQFRTDIGWRELTRGAGAT